MESVNLSLIKAGNAVCPILFESIYYNQYINIAMYGNTGKFCVSELGGRCETHHHCITTTLKDSNSTSKSKVDCINGTAR